MTRQAAPLKPLVVSPVAHEESWALYFASLTENAITILGIEGRREHKGYEVQNVDES